MEHDDRYAQAENIADWLTGRVAILDRNVFLEIVRKLNHELDDAYEDGRADGRQYD